MIAKVWNKVWKFTGVDQTNIYFLDLDKKIIIDCGNRSDNNLAEQFLGKAVDFNQIQIVIFTHLHYDHIGCFDLFKNAKFYASSEEIEDFKARKTVVGNLKEEFLQKLDLKLKPIELIFEDLTISGLKIVKTPGHTRGSLCVWYPEEQILFSGDTLFGNKMFGRTDLPTSVPFELNKSIVKLVDYNFRILCPGHDY
ncbi:MBL fold metallo-hydrolase [Candidatus Woesearchaeota archaeon]|jgi:hydroxyacylglutathione hydrolase|nr:MBL fold metallo-hydrolase [Candidatus Woesearchaeota archaeon]MBT6520329.1 MBL fold metallo-hydrolase [Candidatus Woesearchaeota archaeon]MBT7368282.1 MBL fold metallo-hydrolase [Candidatus Woesearchaeota archaeon]